MAKKLHITQFRSAIKAGIKMELTIKALGFRKLNRMVIHDDNPVIRGMIYKVRHLVRVEEKN